MPTNILLADDHAIVTDGLKLLIGKLLPEAKLTTVSDFEAVMKFLRHTKTQLIVCDINMPGANDFSMVKKIRQQQPDIKLLLLTAYDAQLYAQRYLEEGADAYVSKNVETSLLGEVVLGLLGQRSTRFIMTGSGQRIYQTDDVISPIKQLSNRELEVARLLVDGQGILEIANLLNVQSNTVSTYKTRIFEKLNVKSVPALVAVFHNFNHLHPDNHQTESHKPD
jgi:DNA-binding NarL/FixJ family response regulator